MTVTVFFCGLPPTVTKPDVERLFAKYGAVQSAFLVTKGRRSFGFGYVTYRSRDDAREAVKALNGRTLMGKVVSAYIADSDRHPGAA